MAPPASSTRPVWYIQVIAAMEYISFAYKSQSLSKIVNKSRKVWRQLPGIYVKWTSFEAGISGSKGFFTGRYCSQVRSRHDGQENLLLKHLKSKILTTGAITVAEYMQDVLTHPSSGYYMTSDVFGLQGDFTTSPEISQIFGELIGVWCLDQWHKMGQPMPLHIVELGPGRGTCVNDMLRVFNQFGDVKNYVSLHLVEISPALTKIQIEKLCSIPKEQATLNPKGPLCYNAISRYGIPVSWYLQLEDVPKEFSIFIAHELFDALPVHKFQKTETGWKEVLIDVNESGNQLRYVLSRNPTPASLLYIKPNEARSQLEVCARGGVLAQSLSTRVVEDGGVALIADYGHSGEKSDTFRAFKKHQLVDPLSDPGNCDLTCDVDFSYLKENALQKEVLVYGPINQERFLTNLGIKLRLEMLLQKCDDVTAQDLKSGCNMLIDPAQMGSRFKFLSIFPHVMKPLLDKFPPSGFT